MFLKGWQGLVIRAAGNDCIGCGRETLSRFNTRATEILENRGQEMVS